MASTFWQFQDFICAFLYCFCDGCGGGCQIDQTDERVPSQVWTTHCAVHHHHHHDDDNETELIV